MSQKQLEKSIVVEEIRDSEGKLIAIHLKATEAEEGTWIPTPPNWGLQVGLFKHSKGYRVKAHFHPRRKAGESIGCEALFVINGKLRVELFDDKNRFVKEVVLCKGECLVMMCAHSVEVLNDALALEVKEGPYPGAERDKVWLE